MRHNRHAVATAQKVCSTTAVSALVTVAAAARVSVESLPTFVAPRRGVVFPCVRARGRISFPVM